MDLQDLSDKIEINELLTRYARGVDSEDWDLWKTVFTADAHLDYSSAGAVVGSRDEVADWLRDAMQHLPMKQHYITNVEIEIDGDQAKVRAMFYNPMILPGSTEISACGGYYHHDMVRTADGWRSERLVEQNEWFLNPPG